MNPETYDIELTLPFRVTADLIDGEEVELLQVTLNPEHFEPVVIGSAFTRDQRCEARSLWFDAHNESVQRAKAENKIP